MESFVNPVKLMVRVTSQKGIGRSHDLASLFANPRPRLSCLGDMRVDKMLRNRDAIPPAETREKCRENLLEQLLSLVEKESVDFQTAHEGKCVWVVQMAPYIRGP